MPDVDEISPSDQVTRVARPLAIGLAAAMLFFGLGKCSSGPVVEVDNSARPQPTVTVTETKTKTVKRAFPDECKAIIDIQARYVEALKGQSKATGTIRIAAGSLVKAVASSRNDLVVKAEEDTSKANSDLTDASRQMLTVSQELTRQIADCNTEIGQ